MDKQEKLDIASEIFVLSTLANTKNVIVVACELRGPVDERAFDEALQRMMKAYPHTWSRLNGVWRATEFSIDRIWDCSIPHDFRVSHISSDDEAVSLFEVMMERLRPTLDRGWELFREPPVRLHLMRLSEDHWLVVLVLHHSVGDGGTCAEMGRELLGQYHTIVTGHRPDWLFNPYALSTARKRSVSRKRITWRAAWIEFLTELRDMSEKGVIPAGHGTPGDAREHQIKRVLSEADTLGLARTSARAGGPLVDRLVACANFALDRWNEQHGQPPGLITTGVTVSTKNRFDSDNEFINISALVFRSTPQNRSDPLKFARSLSLARTKFFRNQADSRLIHRIKWLINRARALPLGLRRRLYHYVFEQQRQSVSVTFLGVVWPGFEDGRMTHESCVLRTGDAEIVEVHGTNYKPAASAYANLLSYVYRNRLNLVFTARATDLSPSECREFLDLIVENLLTTYA
jgi:hypothetical protein